MFSVNGIDLPQKKEEVKIGSATMPLGRFFSLL